MKRKLIEISGWLPAFIIPAATILQLIEVYNAQNTTGVSWLTWLLFGLANIGIYIYTEKYKSPQAILGFLGTAILDFIIVTLVILKS